MWQGQVNGKLKVAVIISWRGSNMQGLIEACENKSFPAEVVLVISDRPGSPGLKFAEKHGIKNLFINHKDFSSREEFDKALDNEISASSAELICLAGFVRLLSNWFTQKWKNKVINIHPSLLPAFPGIGAHAKTIERGVKISGCTVHFVDASTDMGPIIIQGAINLNPDETVETLTTRLINEVEKKCFITAVQLIAKGNVKVIGNKAIVKGGPTKVNRLISTG